MDYVVAALCAACLGLNALPSTDSPPPPRLAAPTAQAPPAQSSPPLLTLEAAVARARDAAPLVRAARARARAATAAAPSAARWPNPSLELRTENWQPGGRGPTDPLLDTFVVVTQPVEIAGQRGARRRAADAAAGVADALAASEEQAQVLATAEAFLRAVQARDRLRLLEAQRDGIADTVALLRRRVAEGVTAEGDLRKVEADLARAAIDATRTGTDLFSALATLGALLGAETPPAASALVMPAPATVEDTDPAAALARRADVRAARARTTEAEATLDLEQRRRWPDLFVAGGYKRTAGIDSGVAGVSVPLPLFDRNGRALALAQGEHEAARDELLHIERLARAQIAAARTTAAVLAAEAGRVQRELVAPAEVARRAARSAFREGAGDVLRLLDAERVFVDAASAAIDVNIDAVLATVRARIAAGEVWP